jgi:D-3-phosphoglycerate dehydrogenase
VGKPLALYYDVLDFQDASLQYLEKYFDVIRARDPDQDRAELAPGVRVLFAPMGFAFEGPRLSRYPDLMAIGSPTTGVPHIDVEYARARQITICSLRDEQAFLATITPTAELAWGLVLALTRRIPWAHASVCAGRWDGREFGRRTPRMLSAMTLGVIGLGRLGSLVARYGRAFGMTVSYYDPYRSDDRYVRAKSLDALAEANDVVSLHVHATAETENMIDRAFFAAMRPGAYFINTARGTLVDEAALLAALQTGHLGGAALDTLRGEHLPGFTAGLDAHPLIRYARDHDNLLLTPHYGGATRDAWERTECRIIELIVDDLQNRGAL